MINCCYDLLRQQRGLVPLEVMPEEESPAEDRETSLDVRRVLDELGENDRLVLTLYYLNDLPVRDIAGMLRISEGAVKQRLSHGRKKFGKPMRNGRRERWWRAMRKNDLKRDKGIKKRLEREFQVDRPAGVLFPGGAGRL